MNVETLQPGQQVRFKLKDAHLPSIEEVLSRITADTELQGSVTLLSDQGEQKAAYAVIEVQGILIPIIVPTARIALVATGEKLSALKSW